MGVIYKITSPSDRIYVGKAKNLRTRINSHKCATRRGYNYLINNSIRKYGWDAHKLEILETVDNSLLNEREVALIKEHNSYFLDNPLGMNMTRGGDGNNGSWMHKVELRKWYSEKFTGEGNPFYGKHHTEEFKKRKAIQTSEYNKKNGVKVPEWGAEKGREAVRRKIVCYDLKGNFLKEYNSLASASKELNIHHSTISDSIKGRKSQAKGYVFRYKTDNYPLKIDVGEIRYKTVKRPVVCEYAGEVMVFDGSEEASKYLGIPKTTINRAAMYNNGKPIRAGYKFFYKQNRPRIVGPYA